MIEVSLGALLFTCIVMCLVLLVLLARRLLLVQGEVQVCVNGRLTFRAPIGGKLLPALLENGVSLPLACSSPILMRPTLGFSTPRVNSEKTWPISAN